MQDNAGEPPALRHYLLFMIATTMKTRQVRITMMTGMTIDIPDEETFTSSHMSLRRRISVSSKYFMMAHLETMSSVGYCAVHCLPITSVMTVKSFFSSDASVVLLAKK